MATIVRTKNRGAQLGELIGAEFGAGLGEGYEQERTARAEAQRSELLGDLVDDVRKSRGPEESMSLLALPKYSGLFSSLEEIKGFGEIVNQIHVQGEDDLEKVDISVDGRRRTAFIPNSELRNIGNDDELLAEYTGVEGASFFEGGDSTEDAFLSIIDPSSGKAVQRVQESKFNEDPNKYLAGGKYVTQQGFDNISKLNQERRLSKAANEGDTGDLTTSDTAELVAAQGALIRRDMPLNDDNIRRAVSITRQVDRFSPRLATAFNMAVGDQGFVEKFEGSGDADRFAVAQTTMPNLMFDGMTDSQAFRAALRIGKAIPVTITTPMGGGETKTVTRPPEIQLPTIPVEQKSQFREFAMGLNPRTDVGRIVKRGDKFFVYTGHVDGKPQFSVVEP